SGSSRLHHRIDVGQRAHTDRLQGRAVTRAHGRIALLILLVAVAPQTAAQRFPQFVPAQGDFVAKNFKFTSGEILPELRLHYRTLGKPMRDASGMVRNAVLILHGTGGNGSVFVGNPFFAPQLFAPGAVLDADRYFLIMPDVLGHGQSAKPSDGLRAKFPRYG